MSVARSRSLDTVIVGAMIAARYELFECLGRGGMGVVYRAHDRILDEPVALKLLRTDLGNREDMTRRFRSEIKLARRVTHANVCRIHEYGEDGEQCYISMELIEGTDLKKVIGERGPLPVGEAYEVAIQIADGLQAIHRLGIIHRDLKTPNIMRDAHGVVRLMDFGIAKQFDSATLAGTLSGHIVGTPEYMSPEQARGEKVDHRSDLYAMGIVIFEIFSGDVPFRGDTPMATLFQHIEKPPPLEGGRARLIPAALAPTLRRALAKSPADRHASAEELAQELRQQRSELIASGAVATQVFPVTVQREHSPLPTQTVSAAPTELQPTLPRPPVRERARRVAVGLGVGALGVAALATVIALVLRRPPADERAPATVGPRPTVPAASLMPPSATPVPVHPTPLPTPLATPVPTPLPTPVPTPLRTPVPKPPPSAPPPRLEASPSPPHSVSVSPDPVVASVPPVAVPVKTGLLQLLVLPYAEVKIDGRLLGTTPMKPVTLEAGTYTVWFTHPDYQPLQRRIVIRPGETLRVELDLRREAFPR